MGGQKGGYEGREREREGDRGEKEVECSRKKREWRGRRVSIGHLFKHL